ncbi:HD domain-containing protein [Dehalococcoidia bacterium]|nr:HD domain-containing protein [Dehalococcoidia bacterium]
MQLDSATSIAPPHQVVREGVASREALIFSPEVFAFIGRLRSILESQGIEAYLVGGAVRDALLGRPKYDLDVAVAADVAQVAKLVARNLPSTLVHLDENRQVYRLVPGAGQPQLDLTYLRGSVAGDASERDFTVNTLAIALDEIDLITLKAKVCDPTGLGLSDLEDGRLRVVSDSVFADDGIRLLRGVRLGAQLGFSIEPKTESKIRSEAHLLNGVAEERVRDELCRILKPAGAAGHLRLLDHLGLLTVIIPELEEGRNVVQPEEHYWSVLDHAIETVGAVDQVLRIVPAEELASRDILWDEETGRYFDEEVGGGWNRALMVKMAALLHDVAKPLTRTVENDGRIRFFGHAAIGSEIAREILHRLRFSNRQADMVAGMVKEHLRPGLITGGELPPTRRATYRFFRDAGSVAVDTLYLNMADFLAARGPLMSAAEWGRYNGRVSEMLSAWREQSSAVKPIRLINGHDILRRFGLNPGPKIGELLEIVLESEALGEIETFGEALDLVEEVLKEEDVQSTGSQETK